eukprot:9005687-Pyramimonas_sp.AAC.1
MRVAPEVVSEFDYVSDTIERLSKQLKISARQYWEQITARRVEELNGAVQDNHGSLVQKMLVSSRAGAEDLANGDSQPSPHPQPQHMDGHYAC